MSTLFLTKSRANCLINNNDVKDFLPTANLMCLTLAESLLCIRPPADIMIEVCPDSARKLAISTVPRSTPPLFSAGKICTTTNVITYFEDSKT